MSVAPLDKLALGYRLRFQPVSAYRNAVWKILCERYFSRYIAREAVVLDLGSGYGEFINNICAGKKYAIDLNLSSQSLLSPEVEYFHQDSATCWPLATDSLDTVFTSNFLEHLPDRSAVEATVAEAHRCLKPGGLLLCMGPNVKYVAGAYWDFWDHHIPITDRSCAELLTIFGFDILERCARFLPYSMSLGRRVPLCLVKAYLRCPLVWRLLGKQFLVVARKKVVSEESLTA